MTMTDPAVRARADGRVPTGFREVDDALGGGLARGSLTAIVGHSGVGAGALALQIACRTAAEERLRARVLALDARAEDVLRRALSAQTRVRTADLGHVGLRQHEEAARRVFSDRLHITQVADRESRQVLWSACLDPTGETADLLVIDPLNLVGVVSDELRFPASPDLDDPETADFLRHLKTLAVDDGLVVVTAVHLPAMSTSAHANGPGGRTAHLAAAGAVAQISDNVVLVYRPDQWDECDPRCGEADLVLAKGPRGIPSTHTVAHQLHLNRFADFL